MLSIRIFYYLTSCNPINSSIQKKWQNYHIVTIELILQAAILGIEQAVHGVTMCVFFLPFKQVQSATLSSSIASHAYDATLARTFHEF